ncbi:unnamed protein product [Phytophthora lilii]|uniref:Unnamed protein product n=1 Tax=Phytophthora lilii TaxID=2077276 RepID=A0A9W6XEQ8_9STRA|nr:unnamed protein product [Phytophthora lilii]
MDPKNANTSNWRPLLPTLSSASYLSVAKRSKESSSNHIRKLDVEQREDKSARPDLSNDEERVNTAANIVGMTGTAAKEKMEQKLWLSMNITPGRVKDMLKVVSKEDANYRRYSRYFFKYYVKNLDAPISHLPEKTIEDIMQARLYYLVNLSRRRKSFQNWDSLVCGLQLVGNRITGTSNSTKQCGLARQAKRNDEIFEA